MMCTNEYRIPSDGSCYLKYLLKEDRLPIYKYIQVPLRRVWLPIKTKRWKYTPSTYIVISTIMQLHYWQTISYIAGVCYAGGLTFRIAGHEE